MHFHFLVDPRRRETAEGSYSGTDPHLWEYLCSKGRRLGVPRDRQRSCRIPCANFLHSLLDHSQARLELAMSDQSDNPACSSIQAWKLAPNSRYLAIFSLVGLRGSGVS